MPRMFLLLVFVAIACAREPSRGEAPPSLDGDAPIDAGERPAPSRIDPCPSGAALPPTGFARHSSGDLVAFEPATGRELARRPIGSEIIDLAWVERARRVLVTTVEGLDVEGSRVHALSFDGTGFTHEASSEVFPGEVRVISSPARVLVLGGESSSDWYELDDDLAVVVQGGALPRPLLVAVPDVDSVLALRREPHADVVSRVSGFAAGWTSVELALPRAAPERGVVVGSAAEHSWLLGRGDSPDGFEVARLEKASFPLAGHRSFRTVPGSCGSGALHSLGVDASGRALVTVTGATLDQLAVVPTFPGGAARCTGLGARLERATAWVPRNLIVDAGGQQAWVATEAGVESFALGPSVEKLPCFAGTELRAPLTLAR